MTDNQFCLVKMQKSFNIERFHNLLALNLGYKRILNKSYDIKVKCDEQDIPVLYIKGSDGQTMSYNLAEGYESIRSSVKLEDIREIIDAAHQAYIECTKELITFSQRQ